MSSKKTFFNIIAWTFHRSYRSAKSTTAAETLAANKIFNQLVMLKLVFETTFELETNRMVVVNAKNLYGALITRQNTV